VTLQVEQLVVRFDGREALDAATLQVADGETVSVLGPSGCGKSTLLRAVAGLERPAAGRVLLDGSDLANVPPHRRGMGLMFQDGALFPHRDVHGNVAFGLRMDGVPAAEIRSRVSELLELVGLAGMESRSVATLSGGERQRVALARALAPRPSLLLLDEPLASLDGPLRERLLADLETLFDLLRPTVVHVTHDVGEAFALADRVAVMREGRIVQVADPESLWARPADEWVARFLGLRNVRRERDRVVVVRPEAVRVRPGDGATVRSAERRGSVVRLLLTLDDGEQLEAATTEIEHPRTGDRVAVEIDEDGVAEIGPWPPQNGAA
jgi:thiamine transport system ATP-binding protein